MTTTFVPLSPLQNELLAAFPPATQERLFPHLELYAMQLGQVIYGCGDLQSHFYFPTTSIVSLLNVMQDGTAAEVAVVGKEGLVGVALFMGGDTTTSRGVIRSAGTSFRLPVPILKDEISRDNELLVLLLRYTQSLITQIAQIAVCNRHHTLKQQLCRWLLMSLDRLPDNTLSMTQELIASLLGVRREGITEAAGNLQRLGIIKYSRGYITVLDRQRLEETSCECYQVVKIENDRLLLQQAKHAELELQLTRTVRG